MLKDLIRKVANASGEELGIDPTEWYREKFGAEPNYSTLLDALAKTPEERQRLLRAYFEPSSEEDRTQGLKLPSEAHKAIARLVVAGYLRVIITTNFDRLMEKALEEVGVTPTVISTADQIVGALPLVHSGPTVIKLHGDYLDVRIKNTGPELDTYDDAFNSLLDRIFDEYGLIICGWSGDWDSALRSAFERCTNRRFSTFWVAKSTLSDNANRIVNHRRATVIQNQDADSFFKSLEEKVFTLEGMAAPHPLSANMAAATVKRYLVDPAARIRLRDLIHEETEKLYAEINGPQFETGGRFDFSTELIERIKRYESLCEMLISIFIVGCYWGGKEEIKHWISSLERIADLPVRGWDERLLELRRYPALLLLYAAGLAAMAAGKYGILADILTKPKVKDSSYRPRPIYLTVYPSAVNNNDVWKKIPAYARHYTPVSSHLCEYFREPMKQFLPRDEDYEAVFDRFEYLLGLAHANLGRWPATGGGWWGPVGCFIWRNGRFGESKRIFQVMDDEINEQAENWPLWKACSFSGTLEQMKENKAKYDTFLSAIQIHFI